ncbi:hypothetical protein JXA02_11960 [candidate division KSB1 bacterium]|nr:hypothetical protein [candidate division KSB1 bacterium]RQW01894.1 MAG: hypothetical protein EH222_14300 [candidate division KSB1 bacterium]
MKILVLILIPVLFLVPLSLAEEIGAITLSIDHYLAQKAAFDEIATTGSAFGLLVPVRLPNVIAHLKIKYASHRVDGGRTDNPNAEFLHISNEVLVGYKSCQKNSVVILPQIGIGVTGERYKVDEGVGGAHADIFFDLSCRIDYQLKRFSIGAMVNLERDLNLGLGSYISENRLSLSLLVSK